MSSNTTYANGNDGIQAGAGCTVQNNTARSNAGFGFNLGTDTTYRENTVTNNTVGTVDGGVNMGSNSCDGATSCP